MSIEIALGIVVAVMIIIALPFIIAGVGMMIGAALLVGVAVAFVCLLVEAGLPPWLAIVAPLPTAMFILWLWEKLSTPSGAPLDK